MDLFDEIASRIRAALPGLPDGLTVEPPRDPAHGDLATNAALLGGGAVRARAGELALALAADPLVAGASVAGPGFVNLRLSDEALDAAVRAAAAGGERFGAGRAGRGRVSVEFASAYPTGPLTPSHLRQAAVGDALARVLEFAGHEVVRDYYVGDGGAQADTLARAVRGARDGGTEDAFLAELAADAPAGGRSEGDWLAPVRAHAVRKVMEGVRADLESLGTGMDRYTSERALLDSGAVAEAVAALDAAGLVSKDGRWTFAATRHGDERDRPLRLEGGAWTYFAADVAAHRARLGGAAALVDVLGGDHAAYVGGLKAAVAALSGGTVPLDVRLVAPVRGGPATARELLGALGPDLARLTLLSRRPDAALDLDIRAARSVSGANPAWAIHHAAASLDGGDGAGPPRTLAMAVAEWPRTVRQAAELREPHRVWSHLHALSEGIRAALARPDGLSREGRGAARAVMGAGLACLGVAYPDGLG
ncbi:MAG: arginine--tRNA ligase domain-containing protein [Hasllibacter sp.]